MQGNNQDNVFLQYLLNYVVYKYVWPIVLKEPTSQSPLYDIMALKFRYV